MFRQVEAATGAAGRGTAAALKGLGSLSKLWGVGLESVAYEEQNISDQSAG